MEGERERLREGRSLLNGRVMPAANHVCGVDGPRKEESVLAYLHTMCDGPIAKESLCNP